MYDNSAYPHIMRKQRCCSTVYNTTSPFNTQKSKKKTIFLIQEKTIYVRSRSCNCEVVTYCLKAYHLLEIDYCIGFPLLCPLYLCVQGKRLLVRFVCLLHTKSGIDISCDVLHLYSNAWYRHIKNNDELIVEQELRPTHLIVN